MNVNAKKDALQKKALELHHTFDGYSTACICTGGGKSRIGVLRAMEVVAAKPNAKIFLMVPTEKLRDITWKDEFEEWGASDIWNNNVTRACYVSVSNFQACEWDLVICDEFHHITPACMPFFTTSEIKSILGLTATPPADSVKKKIIEVLAPISFVYSLEEGVRDGIVAPFNIDVIFTNLNHIDKTVKAGSPKKPFYQSEKQAYDYWNGILEQRRAEIKTYNDNLFKLGYSETGKVEYEQLRRPTPYIDYVSNNNKFIKDQILDFLKKKKTAEIIHFRAIGKRKEILYNSTNKERIAERYIQQCNPNKRYLFFAGSIPQSERLLPGRTFHSKIGDDAYNAFIAGEANSLITIGKLNEGANIPLLDEAFAVQLQATELVLIQRVGRVIRLRDGHKGRMIILCVKDTQDEVWLQKAMKSFNSNKINYYTENEFFAAV